MAEYWVAIEISVQAGVTLEEAWAEVVNEYLAAPGFDVSQAFISFTSPCGYPIRFQEPEDVPLEDRPCPCMDPNHWLVKILYAKKPEGA